MDVEDLKDRAMALADIIEEQTIPIGAGFLLVLFEDGGAGWTTYMTNADDAAMVDIIEDLLTRIRARRGLGAQIKVHEA